MVNNWFQLADKKTTSITKLNILKEIDKLESQEERLSEKRSKLWDKMGNW